jgi:hypothetical protein
VSQPLLPPGLQILACGTLLTFFGWVVFLVRSHRLSLRDSLLWILSTAAVFFLTLFPSVLKRLAEAVAIEVPSNALFALAILYLTLNVLSLTIALSNSASRARRLTQESALLRGEIETLSAQVKELAAERKNVGPE